MGASRAHRVEESHRPPPGDGATPAGSPEEQDDPHEEDGHAGTDHAHVQGRGRTGVESQHRRAHARRTGLVGHGHHVVVLTGHGAVVPETVHREEPGERGQERRTSQAAPEPADGCATRFHASSLGRPAQPAEGTKVLSTNRGRT